jgi:hypothetical protein
MTGSSKWFSSLDLVQCKEYITFEDNSEGKVLSRGTIRVNESFVLKDVALVLNFHFNLLSVSQLLQDGFEVCFKTGLSRVLDSPGKSCVPDCPFLAIFFELIFLTPLALLDVWWPDPPLRFGSGIGDWVT